MFLSGFCLSGTLLGAPDVGLLTQTEVAEAARRVCAACPALDVVVDADTGYGNVANIDPHGRAVGAGRCRRDLPRGPGVAEAVRAHGGQGGRRRATSGWRKLRAACDRAPDALHVTARTDARGAIDLGRGDRAGDGWRVTSVSTRCSSRRRRACEELDAIAQALPGTTLVANMVETGRTPLLTPAELADRGFHADRLAGVGAVRRGEGDAGVARRGCTTTGTLRDDLDQLVDFDDVHRDRRARPSTRRGSRRYA